MKQWAGLLLLAITIVSTSGCSWFSLDWLWGEHGYFRDRANDYQESRQSPEMRVPSNIETRPLDPLLVIPRNVADSRVTGGYEVPRPQKLTIANNPQDFSLQTTKDQRWLIAQRPPAQLWTATRQFLTSNGFKIDGEKAYMGEMTTAWQKASELSSSLRQSALPEGETRLRIRIEPGVQRNTSEIFILAAHRSTSTATTPNVAWPQRSDDPKLEAAVLDEIQISFLRTEGVGDGISLLAEQEYDAPSRVFLTKDAAGNPLLQLDTDFDRAWSRVGSALESADIRVEDLNRSLGIYYVNLSEGSSGRSAGKQSFWNMIFGGGPDPEEIEARAERYQVRVARISEGTQVSLEKDINTLAPNEVANRVLSMLRQHLDQSAAKQKPGSKGPGPGGSGNDNRGPR
ncbi:Beta-barrel assembly machine subunit BamC [Azomonas agilis]|uniref:Beta-barrel assembly machine subunit BamC n=1 Tax=Azomonas agilis TaxID=116849 RepID=A0A562I2Z4_9GAMM|nr:outer membrane protein assembly factor BamC [Azomonas agilis]TWH65064.1 Beta-barrel assembly machine subunit BamC [Azomonas agilis]